MDSIIKIAVLVTLVGLCRGQVIARGACPPVTVQPNFDLNQYMGRWYEMERFFAIFQVLTDCVTAQYDIQGSNSVSVNNTGYSKFTRDYTTAVGEAKVMDPNVPAKLGVKFFAAQPYGDYWVLSTDYTSYTIVWSCTERSVPFFGKWNTQLAWILTRSPEGISDVERTRLISMLQQVGINTDKFSRTRQTNCPGR